MFGKGKENFVVLLLLLLSKTGTIEIPGSGTFIPSPTPFLSFFSSFLLSFYVNRVETERFVVYFG